MAMITQQVRGQESRSRQTGTRQYFFKVSDRFWQGAEPNRRLQFVDPRQFYLRDRQQPHHCPAGLVADGKAVLRTADGELVQAESRLIAGGQRMQWSSFASVDAAGGRSNLDVVVDYAPNTQEFRSADGFFVGKVNWENGRITATWQGAEVVGLAGNHCVAFCWPDQQLSMHRTSSCVDGSFLIHGLGAKLVAVEAVEPSA